MRKIIILIALPILLFSCKSVSLKRQETIVSVLLYDYQKKVDVYDSNKGMKTTDYLINDTICEDFPFISVVEIKKRRCKIIATSMNRTTIKGWVIINNLGICTRQKERELFLYIFPDYNSIPIVVEEDTDNRLVQITDIHKNWLKIKWIDNKEYWLPPEFQCPNIYTTCN